ncbi:hypothetical protein J132_10157 [Termitomyces sp. J132]|nr:hypothetical protein C0989_005971 [Termitomyces sp. Mn162]KAH0585154.1 hypothetical protein H2248_008412 [Termitomyces sp. 'cryptogamus']KNZ81879.1 hypothetical protein J132_10157 [Termitomyces sp. J132]
MSQTQAASDEPNLGIGSLYIIGFAQARAPHAGLLIPTSSSAGCLVHIRIDRAESPNWQYQARAQNVKGDMFCTTLLKLHDLSDGPITTDQLKLYAGSVAVPDNDEFGECLPWVMRVVDKLQEAGLLQGTDLDLLKDEFQAFASGNRAFARRDRCPNVKVSAFCH